MHLPHQVEAIARGADEEELPTGLDRLTEQAAEEGAVVGDEDARTLRGCGHRDEPR